MSVIPKRLMSGKVVLVGGLCLAASLVVQAAQGGGATAAAAPAAAATKVPVTAHPKGHYAALDA